VCVCVSVWPTPLLVSEGMEDRVGVCGCGFVYLCAGVGVGVGVGVSVWSHSWN